MNARELVEFVNTIESGKSKPILGYNAYAINTGGFRGVAIDTNENVNINEAFNKVEINDVSILVKGVPHKVIFLYTKEEYLNEKYGAICLDFLDLDKRNIISNYPLDWFVEWKELIGNTVKNKMIYDVIGEMKTLLILQKKGEHPIWNSTNKGTYDITTDRFVCEVKTTKSKTHNVITIHNQFQLETKTLNKELYIAFCKVEENEAGESIDSIYNDLINCGFNKEILDDYLDECGYSKGKVERYISFTVNEIRFYIVDENFPRIAVEMFKDEKIPDGIINYQYTISLDGLSYERLI